MTHDLLFAICISCVKGYNKISKYPFPVKIKEIYFLLIFLPLETFTSKHMIRAVHIMKQGTQSESIKCRHTRVMTFRERKKQRIWIPVTDVTSRCANIIRHSANFSSFPSRANEESRSFSCTSQNRRLSIPSATLPLSFAFINRFLGSSDLTFRRLSWRLDILSIVLYGSLGFSLSSRRIRNRSKILTHCRRK